jgi:hypothetical protein
MNLFHSFAAHCILLYPQIGRNVCRTYRVTVAARELWVR